MSSDISRESFDPRKSYSSVRMQQGRLLSDADWNEQARIFQHALQTLTRSLLGPHALAPHDPKQGFAITDVAWDAEGLRCHVQPGRYYVDGVPVDNHVAREFMFPVTATENSVLLYLDAWEEEVGSLQDPALDDPALAGANASQRTRVNWRLRCTPLAISERIIDGIPDVLRGSPPAQLRLRDTRYLGIENRLYRVEIQRGGLIGASPPPSYKWSRSNGSDSAAIMDIAIAGDLLRIRIEPSHFTSESWRKAGTGDWVEYCGGKAFIGDYSLMQLVTVDADLLTLRPDQRLLDHLRNSLDEKCFVRLWNHAGDVEHEGGVPMVSGDAWQALEDGIEIAFGSGYVQAGDAWMIPARGADGGLLWPAADAMPPMQPRRFLAPLAQVERSDRQGQAIINDCRYRVTIQRQRMQD